MAVHVDVKDWQARAEAVLRQRCVDLESLPPLPDESGETPEDRAHRLAQQAANRAVRWRKRLPAMYAEADLNDLAADQHRETIGGWLDSTSPTLLLAGVVGGGKTHAAYAVGNCAVTRGLHVEAATVHDLLQALRPDGDALLRQHARDADLVVLDDLGATKATEFAVDEVTALVDYRLNTGKRLVVTTNATAPVLAEVWGSRLVDRLLHRATVAVFAGASRRVAW